MWEMDIRVPYLVCPNISSILLSCSPGFKTKQKVLNVTCENQIHVCKLKLLRCNLQNKIDICDTFMGEHGTQKQLHISSLFSLESIDWCSVIKPQITIANDYFGGEQI